MDGVSFDIRPGDRIGLVGPNGCGKTTLLRILAGRDEPDGGACRPHCSVHLGFLEQQAKFEPGQTLYDEAKTALSALIALQEEAQAVAEEISRSSDPIEHKRLAAPVRSSATRTSYKRRLQSRPQNQAGAGRIGIFARSPGPGGRTFKRRRTKSTFAGQTLAGRAQFDDPRRAVESSRSCGHRVARGFFAGRFGGDDRSQPRPLFSGQSDQPHDRAFPRHGRVVRRQFLGLLAAKSRTPACPTTDLRKTERGNRKDQGFYPPQRIRAETRPGRRPAEKTGASGG